MTSNQVTAAIGFANIEELERHNKVTESQRDKELDLTESYNNWMKEWNNEKNRLTEEYNNAMIAYNQASLDEKTYYDSEMTRIQSQLADTDAYYKGIIANVQEEKNTLTAEMNKETQRANMALERLRNTENWLTKKDLEYKETATIASNALRELELNQNLLLSREKMNNDLTVQLTAAKQKERELQLEADKLKVDNASKVVTTSSTLASTLLLGAQGLFGAITGGYYGKIASKFQKR